MRQMETDERRRELACSDRSILDGRKANTPQLDIMGVYPSPLAKMLLIEGNKFWFVSLLCSLTLGFLQLFSPLPSSSSKEKRNGKENNTMRAKATRRVVKMKLVADACDLLVPGYVLGWIGVSSSVSAVGGCVSSVISIGDLWKDFR